MLISNEPNLFINDVFQTTFSTRSNVASIERRARSLRHRLRRTGPTSLPLSPITGRSSGRSISGRRQWLRPFATQRTLLHHQSDRSCFESLLFLDRCRCYEMVRQLQLINNNNNNNNKIKIML